MNLDCRLIAVKLIQKAIGYMWTATMANNKKDFEAFIDPLYIVCNGNAYTRSAQRLARNNRWKAGGFPGKKRRWRILYEIVGLEIE